MENRSEAEVGRWITRFLAELGPGSSIERFASKYGRINTRNSYLQNLAMYLRWLRNVKGITMSPDELIADNLRCVYESKPTDVQTKRRHLDWLDEYVNRYLVGKGYASKSRQSGANAVKRFYVRNDSPLVGDFDVSEDAELRRPADPLTAADIRAVLSALPISQRLPMLMVWQSSAEISKILGLRWGDLAGLDKGEYPLKLAFYGRKNHAKPYHSYLGRDSIDLLKIWRENWVEYVGREPAPEDYVLVGKSLHESGQIAKLRTLDDHNLNNSMKRAAIKLFKQGLVKNGQPRAWHSHALRHSFETQASHARVSNEIRNFFEGHSNGITAIYNHRAEIFESDLASEYLKIEPLVSLNPDRVTLQAEFGSREKQMLSEYLQLRRDFEALKAEFLASRSERPSPQSTA